MSKPSEVVYFIVIRTTDKRGGAEVREALEAANFPGCSTAIVWAQPYSAFSVGDNERMAELGCHPQNADEILAVAE